MVWIKCDSNQWLWIRKNLLPRFSLPTNTWQSSQCSPLKNRNCFDVRLKTLKQGQTSLTSKLSHSHNREGEGSYVEKTKQKRFLKPWFTRRLAQTIFIEPPSFVLVLTTGLSLNILHLVHGALQESRPAGVELSNSFQVCKIALKRAKDSLTVFHCHRA